MAPHKKEKHIPGYVVHLISMCCMQDQSGTLEFDEFVQMMTELSSE